MPKLLTATMTAALTLGAAAFALAAGTVVVTEERAGSVKKVTFSWTSDGAGAADGATTFTYDGALERLVTVPSGGGTAPTNLYDIVVNDDDTTDVLMGAGQNRSGTVVEQVLATSLGVVANDKLTIHVTNAGASKQGVCYVYIR